MPRLLEPGHELIVGATGMGKSRLVLYKLIYYLSHDIPACYIDPKGETYDGLLALLCSTREGQALWEQRKHRILLLDPNSNSGHILGFNAIEPMRPFFDCQPDLTALVANSVVSHIRRQSGFEVGEAMRMQNIMSAAIGLLVEGGRGLYTLAEIPLLFQQQSFGGEKIDPLNPFVRQLLGNVTHYGTRSFWEQQWSNWNLNDRKQWVQSTEGRIFQYLFNERFLYTVCTSQNATLDFGKVVSEGYWLFVRLPYQVLSDTVTTMLGNLLITKLFYSCMQRGKGQPYRLIVDEARFFNTGPLDVILDTARNYGLFLTLVVQNLEQMSRMSDGRADYRLLDSIITNCRYFSTFNTASKHDKEILADLMFPITGQVVTGIRSNGDYEYLPVAAEQDQYQRRFAELKHREVIIYDKLSGASAQRWLTPDVEVYWPEPAKIAWFEAEHLRSTGRPASEIREEINRRQEGCLALFKEAAAGPQVRKIGPALFEK